MKEITRIKVLIGTIEYSIDRMFVLGNKIPISAYILLSSLVDSIDYCQRQIDAGSTDHSDKIKSLESKFLNLMNRCPEVCVHRERNVIKAILSTQVPLTYDIVGNI